MADKQPLRIGFVPEHFSTPLHYAQTLFQLDASLVPFPSGTGHMISALRGGEIDVGIGLTEGWIAGLGPKPASAPQERGGYALVGTYVTTPLCWAISTGPARTDIVDVASLRGRTLGVSRLGSGSHVMGFVLADQQGWLDGSDAAPFADIRPLQTFAALRQAVNDRTTDFFMWERFTSKRYFAGTDAAQLPAGTALIRPVGEIFTPWPSWHIVARDPADARLAGMFTALNHGVAYFNEHPSENIEYISTALDYTQEDATKWLETVTFADDVRGVKRSVVEHTVATLRKAGVLVGTEAVADAMIGLVKPE